MKITLRENNLLYENFLILSKQEYPLIISFWIIKNMKNLRDNYIFYEQKKNEILNKYLEKDEKGNFIFQDNEDGTKSAQIKDGYADQLGKELNELDSFEIEINPYLLTLDQDFLNKNLNLELKAELFSNLLNFINCD